MPTLVLRENVYTDPRVPVAVESGLYVIGNPNGDAPVLVTTNFMLTFYTVKTDLESAGVDCYLLVIDTGGICVGASVASGRFNADVVKEAMGAPVEIEFAVDLTKDEYGRASFYLLQIKPLLANEVDFNIELDKLDKNSLLLLADKSVGNGLIDDICDIIFVDINNFDKTKTEEIAVEIARFNDEMKKAGKKYVLIGPGRWGTRDKFIGIPVVWSDISMAKVIVETSLKDFPLDASLGSHFFHNVISMNVGYFSVNQMAGKGFIKWDKLYNANVVKRGEYIYHVRYDNCLTIKMDGKKRVSVIEINR
jgi:hypothetical protein